MATKKKAAKKTAAQDCPMCIIHSKNASRFYDKPPKIGKLKNGVCPVCAHVVSTKPG